MLSHVFGGQRAIYQTQVMGLGGQNLYLRRLARLPISLAAFRLQTNRVSAHLVGATSTTFAAMLHPLALSIAAFLISSFSHFI